MAKDIDALIFKDIPLNGKLVTSVDPSLIGPNFSQLTNLRYTDYGIQSIRGYTVINTSGETAYPNIRNGYHFKKEQPQESHTLVQVANTAYSWEYLVSLYGSIPNTFTGSFTAAANGNILVVEGARATVKKQASTGYFSGAPNEQVVYCNSVDSVIWGGEEMFCSAFINFDPTSDSFEYDATDIINNTSDNPDSKFILKRDGNTANFYIGALRPMQQFKLYIKDFNSNASTMTVKYWNGSAWVTPTQLDNTTVGGVSLAQTGTVTFLDGIEDLNTPRFIGGKFLYWVKVDVTSVDSSTSIYKITVKTPAQQIKDLWDGTYRPAARVLLFDVGAANQNRDMTLQTAERDYNKTILSTHLEAEDIDAPNDYLLIGFVEPSTGVNFEFGEGSSTAASTLSVYYWNGTAWTAVTGLLDGTSNGSASLNKSGIVSWSPVDVFNDWEVARKEFPKTDEGETSLYFYKFVWSASISDGTDIDYIGGVPAPRAIGNYKFPIFAHNRLFLCSNQEGSKNSVLVSAVGSASVWNGEDSSELFFGGQEELTAGTGLYRRFDSSLYNVVVFCKKNETWALTGNSPDDWVQHQVSGAVGCVAGKTMVSAYADVEGTGVLSNIALWQGAHGIYLFDGASLMRVSDDIQNLFDTRDVKAISQSKIADSAAFFDPNTQEYHWLFSVSGTALDTEYVYDVRRKKWYRTSRTTGTCGFSVTDTVGNVYMYMGAKVGSTTGYLYRLENGNTFNTANITGTFQLGGLNLENSAVVETQIRYIKLTAVAKTNTTNLINGTHFGDGKTSGTTFTMNPVESGYRLAMETQTHGWGHHIFHEIQLYLSTNNEPYGFEPLILSIGYRPIRRDFN